MNKSTKATEKLITLCGKKLVVDCPTRWSSTYPLFTRMLEVRVALTQVLEELELGNLATSEWKLLESMRDLLQPFARYTTLLGGEEYTTLSVVVPAIMEIELHLREMKSQRGLAGAVTLPETEMKRWFDRILNPKADGYEPTFLVATALDPRYQVVLDAEQIASARAALVSQLKEMRQQSPTQSPSSSSTGSPAALVSVEENFTEGEPPKK